MSEARLGVMGDADEFSGLRTMRTVWLCVPCKPVVRIRGRRHSKTVATERASSTSAGVSLYLSQIHLYLRVRPHFLKAVADLRVGEGPSLQ